MAAKKHEPATLTKPCAQCPWRRSNQGKRSPGGFYSADNLRRLWGQVRSGGAQSCHLTDPSHPDHIAAGCKPDSKPRECPGSVIVVLRELHRAAGPTANLTPEAMRAYLRTRKRGLLLSGFQYWVLKRIQFGHIAALGGEGPVPDVDVNDPEVGLPARLADG